MLNNRDGLRTAVIVNDLSEVNIDADLIRDLADEQVGDGPVVVLVLAEGERRGDGGALSRTDERLVELSNGCICCTSPAWSSAPRGPSTPSACGTSSAKDSAVRAAS
ncbi:GTP-binding protein [Actinocorallia herbida]|uniref:GTP-binding protein n=1 Tax=Actinocorallia herbida TaxID=58109 RepID=UPI002482BC52|nr:GTP-binding protein [Actinocorallia herbida]